MRSLMAGLRASGNGSASRTIPTRMSTRSKSVQLIGTGSIPARLPARRTWPKRGEGGARVVVTHDLLRRVPLLGHGLRAPLVETDPVAVAAAHEAGEGMIHGHGEEGALQRVVADEPPEIVATQDGAAPRALDGDAGDAQRHAPLQVLERSVMVPTEIPPRRSAV